MKRNEFYTHLEDAGIYRPTFFVRCLFMVKCRETNAIVTWKKHMGKDGC